MKAYYFTLTQTQRRTGEPIGKTVGVVFAQNEDEARDKAWELAGSDTACGLEVFEADMEKGFKFTVYKSQI